MANIFDIIFFLWYNEFVLYILNIIFMKTFLVKSAIFSLLMLITLNTYANKEINCSSLDVFSSYNCNQCFDGWKIWKWDKLTFLSDLWTNKSWNPQIMYKEEQFLPKLHNLNNHSFSQNPDNNLTFWEYTEELNWLYNDIFDGYVLDNNSDVEFIKSSLWSSYTLNTTWTEWDNVWLLVYELISHNIIEDEINFNDFPHKECVLYRYWEKEETVETTTIPEAEEEEDTPAPKPEEMTKVQTWPWMWLIIFLSFILSIVFINKKTILKK